jgi:hypothetical protein
MNALMKLIFGEKTKSDDKQPEKNMCSVHIELGGTGHTFYQRLDFAERLGEVLVQPEVGEMFTYKLANGNWYALNLDHVEYVKVLLDREEIESNDDDGYTVYLRSQKVTIPFEEIVEDDDHHVLNGLEQPFIKIGNHYFNRDEVMLIVRKRDTE